MGKTGARRHARGHLKPPRHHEGPCGNAGAGRMTHVRRRMAQAGGTRRGSTGLRRAGLCPSATDRRRSLAGTGRDSIRCGSWGHTTGEAHMQDDIRAAAAQYYDANPTIPDDRAFYMARLPSADAAVLELGCGTGRVLLPLAAACGSIYGLERSPAMLARCRQELQVSGLPSTKARAELGDITHFALGRRFDLIIAPYRVFQLLETEAQVEGLFRCMRAHLAPGGTGILNVFHPQGGFERVRQEWERVPEVCLWEVTVDGVRPNRAMTSFTLVGHSADFTPSVPTGISPGG